MRRIILLLMMITAAWRSYAQQNDSITFHITIANAAALTGISQSGGQTIPVFSDPALNTIVANYHISEFSQAHAGSREQYLRDIYEVRCNSMSLAADLQAANPALFPYARRQAPGALLGYSPTEMSDPGVYTDYLRFIKAEDAWGITKGDPSVVIGVTDDGFDMTNRDLYPKVNTRVGSTTPFSHGTNVAGLAAGYTDNDYAYPSIGFKSRLYLSTNKFLEEMRGISLKNIRIQNGSWYDPRQGRENVLNLRGHFPDQGLCNEIYENGSFVCMGAGNGPMIGEDAWKYLFPASYDHVFSTTNVSWEFTSGVFNVKGMHEHSLGDSISCFQHNDRVDLCAPAVRISGLTYSASDTSKHYMWAEYWGTSMASPMVAGTAALIQAALKNKAPEFKDANYSPYQLEYLLKLSADASMLSKPENLRYQGRLGAGALNAFSAVQNVVGVKDIDGSDIIKAHNPNNPVTQTMYIQGIEINTICKPDSASNGVKPKLKPVIVNGTPPYKYVWEAVPGKNNALLDDENIAEPTIISSRFPDTVYYRLTVYDNSKLRSGDTTATAQKVAMKTFRIHLKGGKHDLAMRDSYVDMMEEANRQASFFARDWDIWTSPDVWNRQTDDDILTQENPEFKSTPNYVYARVRNVGCKPSPTSSRLRLYWTRASSGENWSGDWTTKDDAADGGGPLVPAGREITPVDSSNPFLSGIPIPAIQPGDEMIFKYPWYPTNPELYEGKPKNVAVCLLARITESGWTDPDGTIHWFGMTIPEVSEEKVTVNVRNNNNIVTHNMMLTNINPLDKRTDERFLTVANANNTAQIFNFEFSTQRAIFSHFAGDFSSLGKVTLSLGNLYDRWESAGSLGVYASKNPDTKSVTFDGANTLLLEGIELNPEEQFIIKVQFELHGSVTSVEETSTHIFHARQFLQNSPDEVYGAVNYTLTVSPGNSNNYRVTKEDSSSNILVNSNFKVSPNPTKGNLRISYQGENENPANIIVTDMVGKKVMSEQITFSPGLTKEINLSRLSTGVYLINITNENGKTDVFKVVKE